MPAPVLPAPVRALPTRVDLEDGRPRVQYWEIPRPGGPVMPSIPLETSLRTTEIRRLKEHLSDHPNLKINLFGCEGMTLQEKSDIESMSANPVDYKILETASREFASKHPFPTQCNLIEHLANTSPLKEEIVSYANNTYPILHSDVNVLIQDFIKMKKEHGTRIEKGLYQDITPEVFIDRLLKKRPLSFLADADHYLLRNGRRGWGGFETIGTDSERPPLCLNDYLSYDEMQISALLGMSVPTRFINNGCRDNRGIPGTRGEFIENGVLVGLVGARFEKPGKMEAQHLLITPQQNIEKNGFGIGGSGKNPLLQVWARFYGLPHFPTFQEAQWDTTGKYLKLDDRTFLNIEAYKRRLQVVVEPFLLDANCRAEKEKLKAYVHAVGIGLGVWEISREQGKIIVQVYAELIAKHAFKHIADIDFSWFPSSCTECVGKKNGETLHGIKIHFSKRNPAMTLPAKDKNKLLVVNYAWDGNSYPGNEYWLGSEHLAGSGDPAAASYSLIPQLQNPEINPRVSGQFARFYG